MAVLRYAFHAMVRLNPSIITLYARKYQGNFPWIEFFTQHRKLGWHVILIAHHIEMIDKQIRPLAEYESRFRNLQKVKLPIIGLPLSPFPLFLVIRRYAGLGAGSSIIADRDLYPLPLWAAKLYDSLLVFDAESWGKESDPQLCGRPPDRPSLAGDRTPYAVRQSSLSGPHWDSYIQTINEVR